MPEAKNPEVLWIDLCMLCSRCSLLPYIAITYVHKSFTRHQTSSIIIPIFNTVSLDEKSGAAWIPYNFTEARILLTPSFQKCPSVPVFYIIRTHPRNQRWRTIVRSTWAGPLRNSLTFVLGVEKEGEIHEMVKMEAEKYGDLIVFDMLDTYNNMTLKSINILHWISRACQMPRFIVQGDPDIVAFPEEISAFTSKLDTNTTAVYGKCWKSARALREDNSKWVMNQLIYASATYPTYLAGAAWLSTPATASRLLMASKKPLSYIHIDDMLISGIFAELMDVQRVCLKTIVNMNDFKSMKQCQNRGILAVLELTEYEVLKIMVDYRETSIICRSNFP